MLEWLQSTWLVTRAYLIALIAAAVLIGFMLVNAIFSVWLERRSPAASRIASAHRVGGKFGWLQTLADGMKLLVKEDTIPAPRMIFFRLGPASPCFTAHSSRLSRPLRQRRRRPRDEHRALSFMLAVMSSEVRHHPHRLRLRQQWSLLAACVKPHRWSATKPMALCVLIPRDRRRQHESQSGRLTQSEGTRGSSSTIRSRSARSGPTSPAPWPARKRAPFDLAEAERTRRRLSYGVLRLSLARDLHGRIWLDVRGERHRGHHVLGGWSIGIPTHFRFFGTEFGITGELTELLGSEQYLGWDSPASRSAISSTGRVHHQGLAARVQMMWVRWTPPRRASIK